MYNAGIAMILIALSLLWWFVRRWLRRPKNPFTLTWDLGSKDSSTKLFSQQDDTLERPFDWSEVSEEQYDTVVIGSGLGGMSTAALLARLGKRVLVLEQHRRAGGCCNAFEFGGVRFHTGFFYIYQADLPKQLMTQLTDGQLEWTTLKSPFDHALVGDSKSDFKRVDIQTYASGFRRSLMAAFPNNQEDVERIESLLKAGHVEALGQIVWFKLLRWLPLRLAHLLASALEKGWLGGISFNAKCTVDSVLTAATQNAALRAAIAYMPANMCDCPAEINWFTYCCLIGGYLSNGSHMPVGGISKMTFDLIRAVEKRGGMVRVGADVRQFTLDDKGRINGVEVWSRKTGTLHKISTKCVVSSAGVPTTFGKLLPPQVKTRYRQYVRPDDQATRSHGYLFVNVVLNGSPAEFKLDKLYHCWASPLDPHRYGVWLRKSAAEAYEELTRPEGADDFSLFIAFPSTNPEWQKQLTGKTACECLVPLSGKNVKDDKYPNLTDLIAKAAWKQMLRYFPQFTDDKIEKFGALSLFDLEEQLGRPDGAMYGNNMMSERYRDLHQMADLRPKTDVPGLYIAGQDCTQPGFNATISSSLVCASEITGRNLMADFTAAQRKREQDVEERFNANI